MQDLPKNWPTFIGDIIAKSQTNERLCQNTMVIFKLLGDELLHLLQGRGIQESTKSPKDLKCNCNECQFAQAFQLCLPQSLWNQAKTKHSMCNELAHVFQLCQFVLMRQTITDMESACASGSNDNQNFILNIALFLCIFLEKHHLDLIKKTPGLHALWSDICLEYWKHISDGLGDSIQIMGNDWISLPLFSKIRLLLISRMAQPEEVLVENEQGEVVGEFIHDTDSINLYKDMKRTLFFLTRLNYMDTKQIITEKLRNQVNGTEWSWKNLNTLCWAIGSISGAMHEEDEKIFLDTVLRDLFELQLRPGIGNDKKIITANIMFIVGQYPRFLRARWSFLQITVNQLFELMHETHYGMRVMACDTFLKIAKNCSELFVQRQDGEVRPFIEEIINDFIAITGGLQPQQIDTFFEAVIYMIWAQADTLVREYLGQKAMGIFTQGHEEIKKRFISAVMNRFSKEEFGRNYYRSPIHT